MVDVLIIGAGPAGLTSAIYASRAGLEVLVLDKGAPGGKLNLTAMIENYPGITEQGPKLAYSIYQQATSFGATIKYQEVNKIEKEDNYFKVITSKEEIKAKNVIIASGTKERTMNIPLEQELVGRGISYCAVCDGPFFKGKDVAVIGGGNSALEESLYLSTIVNRVHLIVRRNVFRGDAYYINKVKECKNIEIHFLKKPHSIIEKDNKVVGLIIEDSNTKELTTISLSAIFPFIGLDPITDFVKDLGITNKQGYIKTNEYMETSIPGIYAIGDVREKGLRQVVTACNDGAICGQYIASK